MVSDHHWHSWLRTGNVMPHSQAGAPTWHAHVKYSLSPTGLEANISLAPRPILVCKGTIKTLVTQDQMHVHTIAQALLV